jgi:Putative auto-transporter adhesin, head GIN domain
LEIHHSGSGILRISGQVEEQSITLNGVGSYNAPGLDSQRAQVRISGAGSARIHVSQALEASLRGEAILEYRGGALVRQQVSGMGQVVHITNTMATANQ